MKVIERLRPEAQPMDAEWSAATLEGIFAAQPSSALTSRGGSGRGFALVGAATAAALGLGGVAYAAGIVPASVTEFFTDTSAAAGSDVHGVATFKTSDNRVVRTFVIWRGTEAKGLSCTPVLEACSKGGPDFKRNAVAFDGADHYWCCCQKREEALMTYASGRVIHDADSHVMETREWLEPFIAEAVKGALKPLYVRERNRIGDLLDGAKARNTDALIAAVADVLRDKDIDLLD